MFPCVGVAVEKSTRCACVIECSVDAEWIATAGEITQQNTVWMRVRHPTDRRLIYKTVRRRPRIVDFLKGL
jgi:hypothetical protein